MSMRSGAAGQLARAVRSMRRPGDGRSRRSGGSGSAGPAAAAWFAALGLDPCASLTGDDVRSAWRRVAAATHPDRADGGDPSRFAIAAAAYTELRTEFGRREAAAAVRTASAPAGAGRPGRAGLPAAAATSVRAVRDGRPLRLALRVLIAAAAVLAVLAAGPGPAGPALACGAVTWLVITARRDLRLGAHLDASQPPARQRR